MRRRLGGRDCSAILGRPFAVALLALALAALAPAPAVPAAGRSAAGPSKETPEPPPLIEHVTSELVLIEAYVTDPDNHPIRDLTPDDFVLKIDGHVRPIASLEFRELAPSGGPAAAPAGGSAGPGAEPPPPPPRRFVLYFDDAISSPQGLTMARRAAERFLASRLAPSDQVALLEHGRHLRLITDFTTDRAALRAGLDTGLGDRSRVSDFPSTLREQESELRGAAAEGLPKGAGSDRLHGFKFLLESFATRDASLLGDAVRALRSAVEALASWPGYKAILYMGDGISENPAQYYLDRLNDLSAIRAAPPDLTTLAGKLDISLQLKDLIDAADAAGVTIHALATGGLYADEAPDSTTARTPPSSAHRADWHRSHSLETLALNTGGLFSNSNDPLVGLTRAEESSRAYYIIGYAPEGPPDGREHSVQLDLPSKPAFLRWRRGFTRLLPSEARVRAVQAAHALPELYTGLDLDLTAVSGQGGPAGRDADLVVHLPAGRVLFIPVDGRPTARVEVSLVALDEAGRESLRLARQIEIALRPGQAPRDAPGLELFHHVTLPATRQVLTAVVSDLASGAIGGARTRLEPAAAGDRVSGLSIYSLAESSLWVGVGESDRQPVARPSPAGRNLGPTLKSSFKVGEPLACGFKIAAPSEGGTPSLRVEVRSGATVVKSLEVPEEKPGEAVKVPLEAEGLSAGPYLLVVQEVLPDRVVDLAASSFRLRTEEPAAP